MRDPSIDGRLVGPNKAGSLKLTPLPIQIINVSKQLSSIFKLNNISLSIDAGEFFCLLGPSGSGKSTLLGVIGGWVIPDTGQLILGTQDYTNVPTFVRPIRTCFQQGGFLFPHMTVRENVAYSLKVKRTEPAVIESRVKDLLHQVGLDGFQNRKPSQLSGGEIQRVAIARALADPQPILLLDEIQSGLDRHLRASIRDTLINLTVNLQVTSVYVTHDASEALGLASRLNSHLAVLNHGNLEQVGTATEVYRSPRTAFIASLMGEINLLTIQSISDRGIVTNGGNVFTLSGYSNSHYKYLAIRPEVIRFEPYGESVVALLGKVESVEFLGGITRIVTQIRGEQLLIQDSSTTELPKVGEQVACYVQESDILLLAE